MSNPLLRQFRRAITVPGILQQGTTVMDSTGTDAIPRGVPGAPPQVTDVPQQWMNVPFAPGQPMLPWWGQNSYQQTMMDQEPRTFDYVPSVNVTISPRIPYGLLPFSALLYYAENVPEVSMCIRLLTEELKTLRPVIKDENDEPSDVDEIQWMINYPDRYTAWPIWLSRFLFNTLAYDAPALFKIRDDDNKVIGLRIIDGSTIMVTIDERGEQPAPPAPAFTQIIHGTPFMWLTTEQLWYRPRQSRAYAPYGRTPVEDAMRSVMYLDNLWNYELAQYTEGTVPEMVMAAPQGWEPAKVTAYEREFNGRMAGDASEKRRIRFVPEGFTKIETKVAPWNKDGYQTAFERVAYMFGIPLSEIGKAPGAGLGGKGFQEQGAQQYYRQGLGPIKAFVESPFNDALKENGYLGYHFELEFDTSEIDAEKRGIQTDTDWTSGLISRDQALEVKGMNQLGGEAGNVYLMPTGKQFTIGGVPAPEPVPVVVAPGGSPGKPGEEKAPATQEKPGAGAKENAPESAVPEAGTKEAAKFVKANFPGVDFRKHCGVCEEDDVFYGAPLSAVVTAEFPHQGANEADIVAMSLRGVGSRPGVWKPASGENPELVAWVGGPMYLREEATYLVDRTMEMYLVPVSYVSEVNGEPGAVQHYVRGNRPAVMPVGNYAPVWIEAGAILDYVCGQLDRGGHNWLTHPDDPMRPIFIDNGLTFPVDEGVQINSAFLIAWSGRPIGAGNLNALQYLKQKRALWRDLDDLLGGIAVEHAQKRVDLLLETGIVP